MTTKHLSLLLGIGLPILLVLLVVFAVVLPRTLSKPTTDFVYATGLASGYGNKDTPYRDLPSPPDAETRTREFYLVRNGRLVREVQTIQNDDRRRFEPPGSDRTEVRWYVHDVAANQSRSISFEEASRFRLEASRKSSDGFALEHSYGDRGGVIFPFVFLGGGSGESAWVLAGRGVRHQMRLKEPAGNSYYERNVTFLGWILE